MTPDQVASLVARGESRCWSSRARTGTRREAAQTVCAMLNQRGGYVLFGVTPDGGVVGQQVGGRTLEEGDAVRQVRAHRVRDTAVPLHVTRFRGVDRMECLDNRQFHGNAFTLLTSAERFLCDTLPDDVVETGTMPIETWTPNASAVLFCLIPSYSVLFCLIPNRAVTCV